MFSHETEPFSIKYHLTHNLKVAGSNPAPATKKLRKIKILRAALRGGVCACAHRGSTVEARGREIMRNQSPFYPALRNLYFSSARFLAIA